MEALATALERLLFDEAAAEAQALAGLTQARTFTWTGAAATLGRAYTDAWARRQGR